MPASISAPPQTPPVLPQPAVTPSLGAAGSSLSPVLTTGAATPVLFGQSVLPSAQSAQLPIREMLVALLFMMITRLLSSRVAPQPGILLQNAPAALPLQAQAGAISPSLTQEDLVDYLLAGSKGGTTTTDESISGAFARPGSRFSQAGEREFDAVVAQAYAAQFKVYAMGLPAAFLPGQTSIPQVAANIQRSQNVPFTPEAEILSKVAAVYRGELTGVSSKYDNGKLRDLLITWGRSDIVNRDPLVGLADVQSIGGVVKALNEEPNPEIRKAWLQQVFDFQNNTPSSPSGAVPNVTAYQQAINIVRSGQLDALVNNYLNGVRTA